MTGASQPTSLRHDPGSLVVALAHERLLLSALHDLGVKAETIDSSPALGLSLLEFDPASLRPTLHVGEAEDPLEHVQRLLYAGFEASYDGWVPTFGKNRTVGRVTGAHVIDGDRQPRRGSQSDEVVVRHVIDGDGSGAPRATEQLLPPRSGSAGAGVRVGVADTPLVDHPWLAGACLFGPDERPPAQRPAAYAAGHATFVAGLVLQAAPAAAVESRSVLGETGTATSWSLAKELVEFARSGLDVLNLSFGCLTGDNRPPLVLSTAIDRLGPGVLVVAAAGNHGAQSGAPLWPAALDDVVAVGSTTSSGARAPFSPDPATAPWVDVLVPGVDRLSTYFPDDTPVDVGDGRVERFGGRALWSGTSFSAADLTGRIAARVRPGSVDARTAYAQLLAETADAADAGDFADVADPAGPPRLA